MIPLSPKPVCPLPFPFCRLTTCAWRSAPSTGSCPASTPPSPSTSAQTTPPSRYSIQIKFICTCKRSNFLNIQAIQSLKKIKSMMNFFQAAHQAARLLRAAAHVGAEPQRVHQEVPRRAGTEGQCESCTYWTIYC